MPFEIDNENKGLEPFVREDAPNKRWSLSQPTSTIRQSSGGLGCALAGIVIVLVIAMVVVAMFLPPFSIGDRFFGQPYTMLSAASPATASKDNLSIAIDPANAGKGFGVRLRSVENSVFLGQKAAPADDITWLNSARSALPQTLTLLSPVYVIEKQGTASNIKVSVGVPQGAVPALLDLYRYDVKAARWQFVPSHSSEDQTSLIADVKDETALPERFGVFLSNRIVPIIGADIEATQQFKAEMVGLANVIYPAGLVPDASGVLQGVQPAGVATGKGYGVIPVIRNYVTPAAVDVATVATLLQNAGLRSVHIERLIDFATRTSYQGLAIDYRRIPAEQRDNFTSFITELSQKLHNSNLTLTVVLPAPAANFDTAGYDWRAIGAVADNVQFTLPYDPQIFVDGGYFQKTIQWAVGEVNRAKLQVLLSALSIQETDGNYVPTGFGEALAPLGQIALKPINTAPAGNPVEASLNGYNAQFGTLDTTSTPSIKYFKPDGSLAGTMWLTTGAAFGKRLEQIGTYNVAGVVLYDLAAAGVASDIPKALADYKVNQPAAAPIPLSLKWRVSAGATALTEADGEPGKPFTYQPTGDQPSIQFTVEIVGANITLGPATIRITPPQVAAPTIASTPEPTSVSTSVPTDDSSVPRNTSVPQNTEGAAPATSQPGVQPTTAAPDVPTTTPVATEEMMG